MSIEKRAEFSPINDRELVEDFISAFMADPSPVVYRDLMFVVASVYASRVNGRNYAHQDPRILVRDDGLMEVNYIPPTVPSHPFHEATLRRPKGDIYSFRQSPIDPDRRTRAYQLDNARRVYNWVALSQTDRRDILADLLIYSFENV